MQRNAHPRRVLARLLYQPLRDRVFWIVDDPHTLGVGRDIEQRRELPLWAHGQRNACKARAAALWTLNQPLANGVNHLQKNHWQPL